VLEGLELEALISPDQELMFLDRVISIYVKFKKGHVQEVVAHCQRQAPHQEGATTTGKIEDAECPKHSAKA
jgi:hypothetical protein